MSLTKRYLKSKPVCKVTFRLPKEAGEWAQSAAVVGEFIAAGKGLGYLINYNTSLFSTTGALGGILVLAMVVVICNEVINRAESYLLRWRPREERKSEGELY